ncbi:hypothetical protein [Cochleicola gelatinilyticus]|uniref:Uncharacterized protein n=1 Tax=Cochleicola gelatinilyticus TaxID=1763537 RepID=A0A167KAC1_9FLAO|nr:hypothetical protein [Cochleicola gelatinilyticus]OAB81558.1 hypothetical protein ULVI_01690 [Cochleicola gelatinilyticus]
MFKKEFKRIASLENGTFYYHDKNIAVGGGVRSPRIIYLLMVDYKGYTIKIKNETGFSYHGIITCEMKTNGKPLEFELTTRSNFSSLFRRNKERFQINARHLNVEAFLKQSDILKELEQVARKDLFEPTITGVYDGSIFRLTTKYHLQFSDWTQVLEPFISFYKQWIDKYTETKH